MRDDSPLRNARWPARRRQAGTAAVEFALVAVVFFMFVFGIVEVARAMFVLNTLQEVTRRAAYAAASTDFRDAGALDLVRQQAIFRSSAGNLLLAAPVSDEYIRIDYLSVRRESEGSQSFEPISQASLPASPEDNRRVCLRNPNDAGCIRLVRARVCLPDAEGCAPAPFQLLLPLVTLPLSLHTAPTIVAAESLGLAPAAPEIP